MIHFCAAAAGICVCVHRVSRDTFKNRSLQHVHTYLADNCTKKFFGCWMLVPLQLLLPPSSSSSSYPPRRPISTWVSGIFSLAGFAKISAWTCICILLHILHPILIALFKNLCRRHNRRRLAVQTCVSVAEPARSFRCWKIYVFTFQLHIYFFYILQIAGEYLLQSSNFESIFCH